MYSRLCLAAALVLMFCSMASAQAVANFVGTDTQTQGSWQGVYGADGYQIAQSSQNVPSYASFAVQNELNFTWSPSTTDPRALQLPGTSGRIASTWFSNDHLAVPVFDFDVNFTDGNSHQLALYALDWDNTGRVETIQVLDANSNAILDTRRVANFNSGVYYIWNISGHVTINVTLADGTNAVVSGAFFGGSSPGGISVSPASISLSGGQQQTFIATEQNVTNPPVQWSISPSVGTIGSSSGIYAAPASISSIQTVTVTATSTTDHTKFGTATINLTTAAVANFVGTDTSTGGNWQGVYGSDGYAIANANQSIPPYALFGAQNLLGYTWVGNTTDPRALQTGSGGRTATTWFSSHFSNPPIIDFDINFTDGNSHQLALYAVDWDGGGRSETFQVVDATTNAVLDTRTISNFTGGIYLIWNLTGHVQINVSFVSGSNVVVSGAFFGGHTSGGGGSISVSVKPQTITLAANQAQPFTATVTGNANQNVTWSISPSIGTISPSGNYLAPGSISLAQQVTVKATSNVDNTTFGTATVNLTPASAVVNFVLSDTTTLGNWQGVYGGDGYSIANSIQNVPAYAAFAAQNASVFTWNSATTDPRALAVGTGRVASTFYANPSFNFNVSFSDGKSHQVAIYGLDWDGGGRTETANVFDAATGALLNSQTLSGFSGGTYLVWNISGSVRITVTLTGGANAVISGIFFGGGGTAGITVTPSIVGLSAGQQQQFSATSPNVTWSLVGAGSLSTAGLYLAPSPIPSPQSATVTATSKTDATVFGNATVNLSPGAAANFVSKDTTTQGNWQGKYGIDGYSVANDSQSVPAYATFAVQNNTNYTWNAAPNDQRALLRGGSNGRIASCWYYISTFSFDVNMTGGGSHPFELYALDWDNSGRSESIQVVDAASGAVLDTQNISNFGTGVYLIWNISGHVKINVTLTGGANPVISGAFFN